MRRYGVIFCVVVAALAAGCASDKVPAEQAIKAAEAAVAAVGAEATKLVPDQAKTLDAAVASVKDKFAKGEYKAVLTEAPALATRAKEVAAAAAAKKAELTKSWEQMSAGLPQMVDAVKSRIDILSQSKKLPATVTQEKFDAAKAGLAEATKGWEEATTAFKNGALTDALAKGETVKVKTVQALEALGMPVPPAAKS
jgi:hypothetical protein